MNADQPNPSHRTSTPVPSLELTDLDDAAFNGLLPDTHTDSDGEAMPVAALQSNDPLVTLHKHYLRKLRNPTQNDEHDLWQDLVRGTQSQQVDPMQQWMQVAGSRSGLDDLLGQPQSIASVIQGLDSLGSNDLMAPVTHDSVLHLFAPEHLRSPAQASLESLVRHSLPSLTLRDHHRLALDSALPNLPSPP